MREEVRNVQRDLLKIVLAIVAMYLLNILLWFNADPIFSWCESAGVGRGIGGIGWIISDAIRIISIFIVSLLSGVLFPRDRWIARLAATIWLMWSLFSATATLLYISSVAGDQQLAYFFFESYMMPLLCMIVIVLLFSPFFHDFGRLLRSYIKKKRNEIINFDDFTSFI